MSIVNVNDYQMLFLVIVIVHTRQSNLTDDAEDIIDSLNTDQD